MSLKNIYDGHKHGLIQMFVILIGLKDKYPNFEVGLKCILRVFLY